MRVAAVFGVKVRGVRGLGICAADVSGSGGWECVFKHLRTCV